MIRQAPNAIVLLLAMLLVQPVLNAQQDEEKSWAYRLPQAADVPEVKQSDRVINPIDAFILQRLEKEGIEPAALASMTTAHGKHWVKDNTGRLKTAILLLGKKE